MAPSVYLWDCVNDPMQQWKPSSDGQIVNALTGRCLDIQNYNLALEPARRAIAERRLDAAIDAFERVQVKYATKAACQAYASVGLANAQLQAGRLEDAIDTLATIERAREVLFTSSIRTLAAVHLAFAQALDGQREASERRANETRARLVKNRDDRFDYAARLCLAEAVVLLRRGRSDDASALLEKNWAVLCEVLNGNMMRVAAWPRGRAPLRSPHAACVTPTP